MVTKDEPSWHGLVIAVLMLVASSAVNNCNNHFLFTTFTLWVNVKTSHVSYLPKSADPEQHRTT